MGKETKSSTSSNLTRPVQNILISLRNKLLIYLYQFILISHFKNAYVKLGNTKGKRWMYLSDELEMTHRIHVCYLKCQWLFYLSPFRPRHTVYWVNDCIFIFRDR